MKQQLRVLIESEQIADFEIFRRAGLSRSTYYQLLDPARENSPIRKTTTHALAQILHQDVQFIDGIPQFSPKLARSKNISAKYVQKAIRNAVELTGSLEKFSRLSDINIFQLKAILELSSDTIISISSLDQIEIAIDRLDMERLPGGGENNRVSKFESNKSEQSKHSEPESKGLVLGSEELTDIADVGLQQLFKDENIDKYKIAECEVAELSMISLGRNSQTTLEHWVSILYTLRALEKK